MVHGGFIRLLCLFAVFYKGRAVLIQTQQNVIARLGDQVDLNCQLTQSKDVHQVTWQKISPGEERTVATHNKHFGKRVDPGFSSRVELKDGGLQNSSIVIREVTEQDEGCYKCMFNTYPDGALSGLTCIRPYELYGPFLLVRGPNSTGDVVVSCSASGRPPPSMEITVPQQDLSVLETSSDCVSNNDSTVTVTKTAVLSRLHHNNTLVGCAAQVLSLPQTEVFKMISEVKQTPEADGEPEAGHIRRSRTLIVVSVVLGICVCFPLAFFLLYKRKNQTSLPHTNPQMVETSPAADGDPQRTEASTEDNVRVRFRPSPGKNPESVDVSPSPVTPRRLWE